MECSCGSFLSVWRFLNQNKKNPETKVDMEKTLIIKGLVLFGYGEVKSII
jgi:hypothetical protein